MSQKIEFTKNSFYVCCDCSVVCAMGKPRLAFLKDLSERLSRHFDLPIIMPGQTATEEAAEEFYRNDIVEVVNERRTEDFDPGEVLRRYLEEM
jgi:hypothetical protein